MVLLDQAKSTEEKMHDRRNRFLLREVSRTSDWAFPARSGFTTFCHRKVAPKVSAGHLCRDRTAVLPERAQKTALLRRKRLHRFDCGGSAKSASGLCTRLLPVVLHARSGRSNLRPICFLLRCNAESMVRSARHDLFRCNSSILNLAGLRPAGSHCEKSGSSDDTCAESERRVKFCWGYLGGIRETSYLSAYGNTDIPEIPLHRRRRLGCGVPTLRSFVPSVRAP